MDNEALIAYFLLVGFIVVCFVAYRMFQDWLEFKREALELECMKEQE